MNVLRFQYRQPSRASAGILLALLLAYTLAVNAQNSGTGFVFYGQSQVGEEQWNDLLQSLRADLAAGTGDLPNGPGLDHQPTFLRGNGDLPMAVDFSTVIVVKLLGRCDVLPQADRPSRGGPMGWVPRVLGVIQPYIFIDCTRIAQVLRSTSAGLDRHGRQHEMDQAIARVLIHEWIHIATQNAAHGTKGITKPSLTVDELIAGPENGRMAMAHR